MRSTMGGTSADHWKRPAEAPRTTAHLITSTRRDRRRIRRSDRLAWSLRPGSEGHRISGPEPALGHSPSPGFGDSLAGEYGRLRRALASRPTPARDPSFGPGWSPSAVMFTVSVRGDSLRRLWRHLLAPRGSGSKLTTLRV
jgi:hypothetical protein